MRNQMRSEFVKYDQEKMIRKFSLRHDDEYLYIEFLGHDYRINRRTGIVEWSDDNFLTCTEADFNESMTLYDLFCCSKDELHLSGKYCSVYMLKGTVQSSGPGGNMFQQAANEFTGKTQELQQACLHFGQTSPIKGDAAAILYPFTFFPVILQYWDADDEFPANLKFMFDENAQDYMHFETLFYLMGHILRRIREQMALIP